MARANKGSHSFTCYPHAYPQWNEPSCFCFPAAVHHRTLAGTVSSPTEGRRLKCIGIQYQSSFCIVISPTDNWIHDTTKHISHRAVIKLSVVGWNSMAIWYLWLFATIDRMSSLRTTYLSLCLTRRSSCSSAPTPDETSMWTSQWNMICRAMSESWTYVIRTSAGWAAVISSWQRVSVSRGRTAVFSTHPRAITITASWRKWQWVPLSVSRLVSLHLLIYQMKLLHLRWLQCHLFQHKSLRRRHMRHESVRISPPATQDRLVNFYLWCSDLSHLPICDCHYAISITIGFSVVIVFSILVITA